MDDVNKLKSITGITSIWVEEATEITPGDFDQFDLRLRGETPNYKQIIFTYNPIDERHWIKERFHSSPQPLSQGEGLAPNFADSLKNGDDSPSLLERGTGGEDVALLRTTFRHNRFIDADYRRVLAQKALVNPNLYRIYYMGEWGKEEVQRPYVYNFNAAKTVSAEAVFRPELPVYFSIDFNVEPFVCICAHIWKDGSGPPNGFGRVNEHFHIFKELVIEKNGDVYKMLDIITSVFGLPVLSRCLFTGDAMQRKREISQRNNIDAWRIIDQRLNLGRRLMVPRSNPPVKENRHLVNAICAFHPDMKINPDCKPLLHDLQFVEATEEGDILKHNRNHPDQRADALDTFRYMCNTHLGDFLNRPWK